VTQWSESWYRAELGVKPEALGPSPGEGLLSSSSCPRMETLWICLRVGDRVRKDISSVA
jgi:hypothetical protein